MAKSGKSFAEIISQSQVMATGLKNNASEVAKRGIDADFISAFENEREELITLNSEQEKLKADLKLKTEAFNMKKDALIAKLSESRKVVKLAIPQPKWVEFGISDKK